MSMLRNNVRLMGFLGTDPEIKKFEGNKSLARAPLATHSRFMNKAGQWVTETQWHNVVMWDAQAEFAEKYLEKGSEVVLSGKLVNRSYTDKSGAVHYVTEILVSEMAALTKREVEEETP